MKKAKNKIALCIVILCLSMVFAITKADIDMEDTEKLVIACVSLIVGIIAFFYLVDNLEKAKKNLDS